MLSTPASHLLLHASSQCDVTQCQSLILEAAANVNFHNTVGDTPLHCAVSRNALSVTELLLAYGADPNVTRGETYGGETPLHIASKLKFVQVATCLLSANADANIPDAFGKTPLHEAARNGDGMMLLLLLSHGAFHSPSDSCGRTPLDMAAASNRVAAVKLLQQRVGIDNLPAPLTLKQQIEEREKRIIWRETRVEKKKDSGKKGGKKK